MTETENSLADKAIEALHLVMEAGESESTRVRAAQILLDRIAPSKEDDEEQKRALKERDTAIAAARDLLMQFADAKADLLCLRNAVVEACKAGTIDPQGKLADLVGYGRERLG
ncbi:MAG: hypothetical protein WC464_04465 [Bdellovibrionales bacterium]